MTPEAEDLMKQAAMLGSLARDINNRTNHYRYFLMKEVEKQKLLLKNLTVD